MIYDAQLNGTYPDFYIINPYPLNGMLLHQGATNPESMSMVVILYKNKDYTVLGV